MKSITSFILLLPVVCFFLSLQPLSINGAGKTSANTSNILTKVCDSSEDKNFSYSTFNAVPDSQKADLSGLAMIGLRIAAENGSKILEYIDEKMDEANLDPMLQQSLTDCSDHYLDAVEHLDDSVAALLADAFTDVPRIFPTTARN